MELVVDSALERYPACSELLTGDGIEGLKRFETEQLGYLVVNEAFTDLCESELIQEPEGAFRPQRPPKSNRVQQLISFLGEVSQVQLQDRFTTTAVWHKAVKGILPHIDAKEGHTILGYFEVTGNPSISFYPKLTEEKQPWHDAGQQDMYYLGISPDDPEVMLIQSKQLVLINGQAVEAAPDNPDSLVRLPSSLPHAVIADDHNHRSRFMLANF